MNQGGFGHAGSSLRSCKGAGELRGRAGGHAHESAVGGLGGPARGPATEPTWQALAGQREAYHARGDEGWAGGAARAGGR